MIRKPDVKKCKLNILFLLLIFRMILLDVLHPIFQILSEKEIDRLVTIKIVFPICLLHEALN